MWRQALVIGSLVLAAVIVELTLLSRLGLPGATPDLVVVTIVAIALAMGPMQGAVAGFAAGVLIDLAPPGDTMLGVNAIVYVAIGFVVGQAVDPRDRTLVIMTGVAALSAAAAALGTAVLDTLLGSDRVLWGQMLWMLATSGLYAAVLAPLVILGVAWLVRQAAPEALVH